MEITGPLKIGVPDNGGSHEIHLDFRDDFRVLELQQQVDSFRHFITGISREISKLEETIVVTLQTHNPFGNIGGTTIN